MIQLRLLAEGLSYLRELEERKVTVIKAIKEQNKLTDALTKATNSLTTKKALEGLFFAL